MTLFCAPLVSSAYETNCYLWLKERLDNVPPTAQIVPQQREPQVGDIAVMFYEKSGLPHYSVVEAVTNTHILISESNMFHLYKSGAGYRFIPKDYKHLQGFYSTIK